MNEQAIRQVAQELWNDARLLLNATRARQQRKWAATLRTAVGAPPKPPSATAQRAFCREACHRGLGWNEKRRGRCRALTACLPFWHFMRKDV